MEWNTTKKIWQYSTGDQLFELWVPFLGTWPTSGSMRNGLAYEQPTPERLTTDSEFLSQPILATPTTQDSSGICRDHGGDLLHDVTCGCPRAERRAPSLPTPRANEPGSTSPGYGDSLNDFANRLVNGYAKKDLMPTQTVSDTFTGSLGSTQQKDGSLHSVSLAQVFHREDLFPTPIVSDYKNGKSSAGFGLNLPETAKTLMPTPAVSDNRGAAKGEVEKGNPKNRLKVEVELLPTTRTSMANGPTQKEINEGNPKTRIETEVMLGETNWGRFEPAIKRWEQVIDRPAPAPTKPDGKDGNHRLSSKFTEWMMGLPDGWITGHGLSRNDELKLAGNGVVPQQAELALKLLLERAK
jgi:hypothetical protein